MKIKKTILLTAVFTILCSCTQGHSTAQKNQQTIDGKTFPNKIDHIIIVIEENHSEKEIKGNPKAPYMNSLLKQGTYLSNYHAIEHPSQPNYLNLFSGSNQGVTNDAVPKRRFAASNLASSLLSHHYTFAGFSEDLPYTGFTGFSIRRGGYARKHNPWVNFSNVPKEVNQPLTKFPKNFNQLPTVSFVIPNLSHDMHDGSIAEADQWLKSHLSAYVQWAKKNNSLLILTWDEDDNSEKNKIPAIFVGPMVKTGVNSQIANHFSLLRTIEDIYHLPYSGQSKSANPISVIWK